MPFKIGENAIIRTRRYLQSGKIHLNNRIKVFTVNFTENNPRHKGTQDFAVWRIPQIQYTHPDVQCLILKNMTPNPFIRIFSENGDDVVIDTDNKEHSTIQQFVIRVLGKPKKILDAELLAKKTVENTANFGYKCFQHCICQIPGQVPCSAVVPLPQHRRGKWFIKNVLNQ